MWLRPDAIPSDFDDLNAPKSWFLSHRLISHVTDKLTNKQKNIEN